MAVSVCPPLVTPKHYDPMFKVDVLLHEPTIASKTTPAEIEVDMISLCTQLEALLKKELLQQPSHKIQNGKTSSSFVDKANVVIDRMQSVLAKDRSYASILDYLEKTGISRLFPRPAAYLKDCHSFSFALEQTRTDEYLMSMSQLHQLTALAHQIGEDVAKHPRPKYLAHQLALLYQCISSLPNNEPLANHKQSIEDNFKTVKKVMASEDEQDKPLPDQVREWVWELTSQITVLVESLPTQLTQSALLPGYILMQT